MNSTRSAGRWIGLMLLAQVVAGPVVNFGLLGPVFQNPPGYLINAAPHAFAVSLSVLIMLAMGAVSAGIAIAAWPVVRARSERMALWLVVLGAACFALTTVEAAGLMSMLSLSQAYTAAVAPDEVLYQALRGIVGGARNWSHYTQVLSAGGLLFMLYGALCRFSLVPRPLAAFGMAAALLQMTAVAMPLFGQRIVFLMLLPLGVAHLLLAGWLLTKGLREAPAAG